MGKADYDWFDAFKQAVEEVEKESIERGEMPIGDEIEEAPCGEASEDEIRDIVDNMYLGI